MRTATPDAVCAPPLEHCTLLYRATPYPSPSILPSSTAAPSPPTVSTPVLVESATAAALSFLPSFFPFFLPSLASRSASPSSHGPPCSPFIEQAWAAPPDSLYLTLSLFLGYTGCAFLFPPRKLFDALTRPPPVTMRILLLDRSSLEGFHGIRRWKNRSFGGWGRSIDEKGKEATRSIVKHDCVTRLAAPFYREDERKVEARSVARALFRSYRSIYRIFSTNRRRGIRDFVRSKYRK